MLVLSLDLVEFMVFYEAGAGLLEMKGDPGVNTLPVQAQAIYNGIEDGTPVIVY